MGPALLCLWLTAAAPAKAPAAEKAEKAEKAPRDISEFYEVLAHDKNLAPVLVRKDGELTFVADDGPTSGRGEPIIDGKNGYMEYRYSTPGGLYHVVLALFTTKGERKFIIVANGAMEERAQDETVVVMAYEFTGADYREVSGELGIPGVEDFLDSSFPKKFTASSVAGVDIKLPREGTTVVTTLSARHHYSEPGEPSAEDDKEMKEFERTEKAVREHQKYQTLELAWSKTDGKFHVARRKK